MMHTARGKPYLMITWCRVNSQEFAVYRTRHARAQVDPRIRELKQMPHVERISVFDLAASPAGKHPSKIWEWNRENHKG